ncbi:putative repeat protein (TIGR01451 family)/fimbrial isopeptide formation D2 family protein/LPXTG-motif cell wall-anchored protein [Nocardioides thalensis]|uniref:Putative repeat protein (TIGR01451 family)/fimbrial isopeptide formation D2 family protein/LPXTG-motif cell wall-anchored protein n=1 Tax=Nocardioides thalensis TaxID=1914755 RepID=A0A853C3E6_9ACTN|nr:SpaA isopeptide-forming pilin-related protein [Nocardioides thalensis]NYJ01717.1 putative repeat protein (TIGR01451 family)/fimbrial isopeptide formation D2 family protein/LPXTG-motif cell wall-anchored protein [Nocardioides thalensis]
MRHRKRWTTSGLVRRTALLFLVTALYLAGLPSTPVPDSLEPVANETPFSQVFSTNANGAIVSIGNNLLTCPPGSVGSNITCANARAGSPVNNNSFNMVNLDADNVGSTFNSSSSALDLPAGATVLWAGLYWGARLSAGSGGTAGTGTRTQMQFRVPGGGYQTITSQEEFGPNTASSNAYQEFADVTSLVRAAGNGTYWGANVVAGTGQDRYAGWSITVAYSAPGLPLRNLTIFDGFSAVGSGTPETVTVSGFTAPLSGPVDTQLSMVAYEGDLSTSGDFARLNNTQLADGISPGSNFFNGTNDLYGTSVTTRSPADRNMLGYDIKNLGASGAIPNGATSATFTFGSSGDVYFPGVVGLAINLYAPDFTTSSKSVVNLSGNDPARPGDTLEYTLNYANTGQDPAVRSVSEDPLPANTTYVPGSLRILSGPGAGPLTDGAGDDRGELDGRTVRVRLGTGATATSGGTIPVGSSTSYSFRVTLDDAAGGTTVRNLAHLDYATGTTGVEATYDTPPTATPVINRADIGVSKTVAPDPAAVGGAVVATLTVTNDGPNTARQVSVRDPLPAGWAHDGFDAPDGVTCEVVDREARCDVGSIPDGDSVVIRLRGHLQQSTDATSLTNIAYVDTTSYDPDLSDNVSSDTFGVVRSADLAITKTAGRSSAPAGGAVRYTLEVTNNGPTDAVDVVFADTVDDASQLTLTSVVSTTGGASCTAAQGSAVNCTVDTLAAGASAGVVVEGVLATTLEPGTVVGNTGSVGSSVPDPEPSDNRATAQVTVADPVADVRLVKDAPATATAGGTITYDLTATNHGPSPATGVTVTDTVPAGITPTSATASRGTCTISGQTVTCEVGGLPAGPAGEPGGAVQIQVTGTVAAAASGTRTNVADVASTSTDPAPGNNTASATTTIDRVVDLVVTKQANRTSLPAASPGDPRTVRYVITVANEGPSVATGVTVSDKVPLVDGFTVTSAVPDSGTCDTSEAGTPQPGDADHGLITCDLAATIPVGGSQQVVVTMVARADLTTGPDLTETVTASAPGEPSANLGNNEATWTLSGQPVSDLALEKSAPATATAGTTGVYGFEITNNATLEGEAALAPTLVDTLPDGVTLVPAGAPGSVTPAYCTAAGQQVTCDLPIPAMNLDPGQSRTVEITVRFAADLPAGTTLVNVAEARNRPSNPDPAPANNVSSASTTVVAEADVLVTDLTITSPDPSYQGAGSPRDIVFTLRNDGPSVARDVEFRLAVDWDAAIIDGQLPADCALLDGELVCTIDGRDLAPGEEVTFGVRVLIAGYQEAGDYVARVDVTTSTPESDLANNDAQAATTITAPRTELDVTKAAVDPVENPADGHDSFVAGTAFAYQVTVGVPTGIGELIADAQDVTVTDTLPAGMTPTAVSTTAGTCDIAGRTVTCDLGTLSAWPGTDEPVVITVSGTVEVDAEAEQVDNTATATSTTPDTSGSPASGTATATVDIIEMADLQQFKVADAPVTYVGGDVGYTLTTVNAGPSAVEEATVTDTLPTGLTLDPAQSPDCAVTGGTPATGQQVTCSLGALGVGDSISVRVVASTSPDDSPRTITNTATVSSPATDPDPDNDTASVTTDLDVLADVAISSSVSTTTPAAGQDVTFTGYTINNGPSAARDVTGSTTFPAGFVPVSHNVPFNTCEWSPAAPADPYAEPWSDTRYTLTCRSADPSRLFEPGFANTSVVVMHVPTDTPTGTYRAEGQIETSTPESTYANNTTEQVLSVQRVSDLHLTKTLVRPDPMQAGEPATWRITVTNDGPSAANNVVVADRVPDSMTFVRATDDTDDPCPAPEVTDNDVVVRCTLGTLRVGESASATITMVLPDGAGRNVCNTALVGSESLDPAAGDNDDRACGTTIAGRADISLVKVDPADDTRLAGAVFQLYVDDGDGEADPATDRPLGTECTTDAQGRCVRRGLPFGDYFWYEVSPAPGYQVPQDRTSPLITINQANGGTEVGPYRFTNNRLPGAAQVRKVDAVTGKVLEAATFDLYRDTDGDGEYDDGDALMGTCTTNETGTCRLEDLDFGTYFWVETLAPRGYVLPDSPVADPFVIDAGNVGDEQTTTVEDDRAPWTVTKRSDPPSGSEVLAGDVITYTLTASPLTDSGALDARVVDDLADVLDDARFVPGSIDAEAGTARKRGDALRWHIPVLDRPLSLTYQVQVTRDAEEGALVANSASGTGPGAEPCARPGCDNTSHEVGADDGNEPPDCTSSATAACPDPDGDDQDGTLPDTGGPPWWLVPIGLLLVALGAVVVRRSRRA